MQAHSLYVTNIFKGYNTTDNYNYTIISFSNGNKLELNNTNKTINGYGNTSKWMLNTFKNKYSKLNECKISDIFFHLEGYTPLFIADTFDTFNSEGVPDFRIVELSNGYKLKVPINGKGKRDIIYAVDNTPKWMVRLCKLSTDVLRYGKVGNVFYAKNSPLIDYWYD